MFHVFPLQRTFIGPKRPSICREVAYMLPLGPQEVQAEVIR